MKILNMKELFKFPKNYYIDEKSNYKSILDDQEQHL